MQVSRRMMMMGTMAGLGAGLGAGVTPLFAADRMRPATRLPMDAPNPPRAGIVTANAALEAAMARDETGVFRAATARLDDSSIETLVVLDRGRIIDMHSRRGNVYLTRAGGSGIRGNSGATFGRLIALSPVGRPVDAASRNAFLSIANGGGGSGPSAPRCPADYAEMTPAQRARVRGDARYSTCLTTVPRRPDMQVVTRGLQELFGIPAAQAAEWTLVYFKVVPSNFWNQWGVEYNAQAEMFSLVAFGITAIWQTG